MAILTGMTALAVAREAPAQQDQTRRIEAPFKAIDLESCYVKRPTWQDTLQASIGKLRNSNPTFALGQCSLNEQWFRNGPHAVPQGKRSAEVDFKVALTGLDLGAKKPDGSRVWEYEGPVPAGQPYDLKLPARSSLFHCRQFEAEFAGPLDMVVGIKNKDWQKQGAGETDVREFLSHLAIKQRVSSSTQNQAFNALLFLFREVLKIDLHDLSKTVRAKRGPKVPSVLTQDEVRNLLQQLKEKDRLLVHVLYGTGMRLMEVARLRVQDIDFGLNSIIVRAGKGDKDRITVMPEAIKTALGDHLANVKIIHEKDLEKGFGEVYLPEALDKKYPNAAREWGWQYVFPSATLSVDPRSGKVRRHHISPSSIQNIVADAVRKAGIVKHATVHTLRHSFATHLLMDGVNIREVQELLGHKNVETTMIYTHVLRNMAKAPISPLDTLIADEASGKNR